MIIGFESFRAQFLRSESGQHRFFCFPLKLQQNRLKNAELPHEQI
ncbi:Uncharacterized protein dnm_062790 [Desulfonema magnum]|uniref:Uncharacterized protein n=1 Tax=Desulfonema magnum TaxID=45655 RepID=A0A975BRF2_9BACT|nr:Uncharacterized protein dnm_062790 [Desulfonema magnum]